MSPNNGNYSQNFKTLSNPKQTRLKIYNLLALPTLCEECAACELIERDKCRSKPIKIKFLRTTAKCTWQYYKTN